MLTTLDKSNYLKGLLIIARIDNSLVDREKDFIRSAANRLGFSKDFYEEVLKNLMINENISDNPLSFSSVSTTELFLNDAFALAYADNVLSNSELEWLRQTATINGISNQKFTEYIASFQSVNQRDFPQKNVMTA